MNRMFVGLSVVITVPGGLMVWAAFKNFGWQYALFALAGVVALEGMLVVVHLKDPRK